MNLIEDIIKQWTLLRIAINIQTTIYNRSFKEISKTTNALSVFLDEAISRLHGDLPTPILAYIEAYKAILSDDDIMNKRQYYNAEIDLLEYGKKLLGFK